MRKPSRPGMPVTAVGWNCTSSRSASAAPARVRQQQADARARRAGWSSATTAPRCRRSQGRRAARSARGRPRRRSPTQRPRRRPQRGGARLLQTSIRGCSTTSADSWRTTRRPVALPPAWTTRRRVWPPSRPSARLPLRSASKRTPIRSRSADAPAPRRPAPRAALRDEAAAGALGVLRRCRAGESSTAERGGQAALGPVARGLRERRGGDQRTRAPSRAARQRRVQAGRAGADDDDLGRRAREAWRACAGYRTRDGRPVRSSHPSSLDHDTGPHPERPARITAIERGARAPRLARVRASRRRRRRRSSARTPSTRRPTCAAIERAVRGGRRAARRRHRRLARLVGGGAARRRRRGGARRRAAAGDGADRRHRCTARPATTPRRRGRWASACSTTSRSPRSTRATRHGLERVLVLDWDVHHGNGTSDIFYADPSVLFGSIHESPLYPGTGAARRGRGAGEGLHGQPAGAGGLAATTLWRSLVEHVVGAARRAYAPAAGARVGRLRRPRRRPAGELRGDRRRLRGDGRARRRRLPDARRPASASCSRAATTSTRSLARSCAALEVARGATRRPTGRGARAGAAGAGAPGPGRRLAGAGPAGRLTAPERGSGRRARAPPAWSAWPPRRRRRCWSARRTPRRRRPGTRRRPRPRSATGARQLGVAAIAGARRGAAVQAPVLARPASARAAARAQERRGRRRRWARRRPASASVAVTLTTRRSGRARRSATASVAKGTSAGVGRVGPSAGCGRPGAAAAAGRRRATGPASAGPLGRLAPLPTGRPQAEQ